LVAEPEVPLFVQSGSGSPHRLVELAGADTQTSCCLWTVLLFGKRKTNSTGTPIPQLLYSRFTCTARMSVERKKNNWLSRPGYGGGKIHHHLHHLLLINFLGSTPEEFFQLPEVRPLGSGPWPCLNRSVPHFQQPRISKCEIRNSPHIMGTFTCACGFSYRRSGVDKSENRRFEYNRVLSFENAWYALLTKSPRLRFLMPFDESAGQKML
jgi:hypothetical protein